MSSKDGYLTACIIDLTQIASDLCWDRNPHYFILYLLKSKQSGLIPCQIPVVSRTFKQR